MKKGGRVTVQNAVPLKSRERRVVERDKSDSEKMDHRNGKTKKREDLTRRRKLRKNASQGQGKMDLGGGGSAWGTISTRVGLGGKHLSKEFMGKGGTGIRFQK